MGHLFQEERAEHRHERERKNERTEQRERNRKCERTEHLPFETLQSEQREKNNNDDENAEDDWPPNFFSGVEHGLNFAGMPMMVFSGIWFLGEMPVNVLHHHDRAIYHHADTDRETA